MCLQLASLVLCLEFDRVRYVKVCLALGFSTGSHHGGGLHGLLTVVGCTMTAAKSLSLDYLLLIDGILLMISNVLLVKDAYERRHRILHLVCYNRLLRLLLSWVILRTREPSQYLLRVHLVRRVHRCRQRQLRLSLVVLLLHVGLLQHSRGVRQVVHNAQR